MKGQGISKYNVILGYSIFFIIFQLLVIGYAGQVFSSEISSITQPTCDAGFIILDGLLTCAFNYIMLIVSLFTISTTILVIELVFVIPFIIGIVMVIADLLRGSG